jgi:hypothetical protein
MRSWWVVGLMLLATAARAGPAPVDSLHSGPLRPAQEVAATADSDRLAPTSEPPWNPPGAMSSRRPWEQVVLLPGRILSLPFVGVGVVMRHSFLYLEDRGQIPIAPGVPRAKIAPMVGFQVLGLGDRTGLGGALELHSPPAKGIVPMLSARYSATTYLYNSTRLGASYGPLGLQYGYNWQPQDQFYGLGNSSSHDSLSDYAMQDEFVRGTFSQGWGRESATGAPLFMFDAWAGPRSEVTRTGRDAHQVSYDVRFPSLGSATLDQRVEHLVYGGSLSSDWRAGRPHWSHGGRVSFGAERFDVPIGALALHTSQSGAQFTRYSAETEAGASFMRDPRTFRVRLRLTDIDPGTNGGQMLPSDLSRLGGRDGLSGYSPGRFHDLDLLVGRIMYLFPLARLAEVELHSEWGAVYPDIWRNAKLNTLRNSVGLSLRGRSDGAPHGELGIDFSPEGMRLSYTFGQVP